MLTNNWKRDNGFAFPPPPRFLSLAPCPQSVICIQIGNWWLRKQPEVHLKLYQPKHHCLLGRWSGSCVGPLGLGCAAEFPHVISCCPHTGFGAEWTFAKYSAGSTLTYHMRVHFLFSVKLPQEIFWKALQCFNYTMQGRRVEATGLQLP